MYNEHIVSFVYNGKSDKFMYGDIFIKILSNFANLKAKTTEIPTNDIETVIK